MPVDQEPDIPPIDSQERRGDAACWLANVCPDCGAYVDDPTLGVCPRCGGALPPAD